MFIKEVDRLGTPYGPVNDYWVPTLTPDEAGDLAQFFASLRIGLAHMSGVDPGVGYHFRPAMLIATEVILGC
jgi:hypothetical protein